MPLILPFGALFLGSVLLPLSGLLNEELLLLLASVLFFGAVFNRLRQPVAGWSASQADEVYGSLGVLLEMRLLRLAALLGLGRRLLAVASLLDRLVLSLFPLFRPFPVGGSPLLVGSVRRDLEVLPSLLDQSAQRLRLRTLAVLLGDFGRLLGDRLVLTP